MKITWHGLLWESGAQRRGVVRHDTMFLCEISPEEKRKKKRKPLAALFQPDSSITGYLVESFSFASSSLKVSRVVLRPFF
jgi:hypothetical protein